MNKASVQKYCIMFDGELTKVHNKEPSACPSVLTDRLKGRIEVNCEVDRHFILTDRLLSLQVISSNKFQ